jgi:hypothetical protein
MGRTIRVAAGLSLEEVGRDVGAHASTIWRWEVGDKTPGNRTPHGEAAVRWAELMRELAERVRP